MKKYCLQLMGLQSYQRRSEAYPEVLKDVMAFVKRMGLSIRVQQDKMFIGGDSRLVCELNTPMGKQGVWNWIMEKCSE